MLPDHGLDAGFLPGRAECAHDLLDAHAANAQLEVAAVDGVAVTMKVARGGFVRKASITCLIENDEHIAAQNKEFAAPASNARRAALASGLVSGSAQTRNPAAISGRRNIDARTCARLVGASQLTRPLLQHTCG